MSDNAQVPICLHCGYSLVSLAKGKCPECGREFDPADAATVGPRRRRIAYWISSVPPPPNWLLLLHGIGTSVLFGTRSTPTYSSSDWGMLYVWFWALWTIFVCGISFAAILVSSRRVGREGHDAIPSLRWFVPIALLVFWSVVLQTRMVWNIRWHFAQAEFAALGLSSPATWKPGWYSTFHVTSVASMPDGTVQLKLGFPDWYGCDPAQLQFSATASTTPHPSGPDCNLGGGWFLTWDLD